MSNGITFYRCVLCGKVVNLWDLYLIGHCPKCACPRVQPTNLSWWEKIVQIGKHPAVWRWNEKRIMDEANARRSAT